MDLTNIVSIISSVGFPIAAALGLFWYMTKQDENHKEEVKELRQAIENNTLVITRLVDKMENN